MTELVKKQLKTVTTTSIRDSIELVTLVSIFLLAVGGVVPKI